jgi:hypothetical protein
MVSHPDWHVQVVLNAQKRICSCIAFQVVFYEAWIHACDLHCISVTSCLWSHNSHVAVLRCFLPVLITIWLPGNLWCQHAGGFVQASNLRDGRGRMEQKIIGDLWLWRQLQFDLQVSVVASGNQSHGWKIHHHGFICRWFSQSTSVVVEDFPAMFGSPIIFPLNPIGFHEISGNHIKSPFKSPFKSPSNPY